MDLGMVDTCAFGKYFFVCVRVCGPTCEGCIGERNESGYLSSGVAGNVWFGLLTRRRRLWDCSGSLFDAGFAPLSGLICIN